MNNKELNILLTSVGRRSYLVEYFKEALNGIGKIHVSNSFDRTSSFAVADYAVVTPLIYDKEYIPFLLDYCKLNNISAIISLFDVDLPILAKSRKAFEEIGTKIIVSNIEVIDKCNDKWNTYLFLKKNGFNVPKTFLNTDDAINAISQNTLNYPVVVKPRWGMGSIGVYEADNEEELKVFYKKVQRHISDSYLKYESAMDINNSVIIQEKLQGQEYGLDVINDLNGNYQNTICKMKYAMRSGETDCAITVNNNNMKKLGEQLSNSLKHIANLDVDVFLHEDTLTILEMNARFGGGYPFSHMAGVNLPKAIVKWLSNEYVDSSYFSEAINITSQKDINIVIL